MKSNKEREQIGAPLAQIFKVRKVNVPTRPVDPVAINLRRVTGCTVGPREEENKWKNYI